ncbi:MAG TPA: hypothetical protein VKS79_15760 [Gemmataceae bacterium]|nr:hypothetical protein [Gemmataceae bacterium]
MELEEMLLTRRPEDIFAAEDDADWNEWIEFFSRTRQADGRRKGLVEVSFPSFPNSPRSQTPVSPRSQTPVWERAAAKLCFAKQSFAKERPQTEFGNEVNPTEYEKAKEELRILEERLETLQRSHRIGAKGFTKAGIRKMIARLHEELAVYEGSEEAQQSISN